MTDKNNEKINSKTLEDKINKCSRPLNGELHGYCPYIPYSSGYKCKYLGVKIEIPAVKEGVRGIRYVYECKKISVFSKITKRTTEYMLDKGC